MADHNPREHAEAHGAHGHDLKPEHKSEVVKAEASTTPAGEHEGSSHNSRGRENHDHGEPPPLAKLRGPPATQSVKGGQGPHQPKPPTGGKKSKTPEHPTEDDPENENDKSSDSSNDSHGGKEHLADMKKRGKMRGKPAPPTTKGGSGGPSGPPKGPKS